MEANEINVSSMTGWAHYFSVYRLERTSPLCKSLKQPSRNSHLFRIKRRGSQSIVLGGGGGGLLDAGDTCSNFQ